jgi:hypothetical protein
MSWRALFHGGPQDGEQRVTGAAVISVLEETPLITEIGGPMPQSRTPRVGHYIADRRVPLRRLTEHSRLVDYFWGGWADGNP